MNFDLQWVNTKLQVKFDGTCLKLESVTFTHKKVNIYIVYEINLRLFSADKDFDLAHSIFGAIELTTYADPDKYLYSR